jgi:hypothetical protein
MRLVPLLKGPQIILYLFSPYEHTVRCQLHAIWK